MYLYNAIRTPDGTILESTNRHDYKVYVDKNGLEYMVDGGHDYLRRNIYEDYPYEELSIEDNGDSELRRNYLRWGRNYDENMHPLEKTEWILIKDLSTDHIKAILKNVKSTDTIYKETLEYELRKRGVSLSLNG
jgi:hypothetical protein